jgi:membrane protease YdiL (CAAX protease family)
MTAFQQTSLLLTVIWFSLVVLRFRRSIAVLAGGLAVIGVFTLAALAVGRATPEQLGLGFPDSWLLTVGFALAGLEVTVAYSRVADRLASRWVARPPNLEAFRAIQQSRGKLIAGIVAAWVLGGLLEELVARGIVLASLETWLAPRLGFPAAAAIAVGVAALGAGVLHGYQGPRAVAIVAQLSVLFGVLFVASGHNLLAVILCHGLYDTIAFVRFARKKSSYSHLDQDPALSPDL